MSGASERGSCSSRGARAVPRGQGRSGAARAALYHPLPVRATEEPQGARKGGAPRPADGGGAREHLRRRGALVRAPPSAPPGRQLDDDEIRAVHRGVRRALERGIARQGATLRDYRTPDGGSGSMQHEFNVYGREGEPCPRCGTPIEKTRAGGRGTWYCPACQRLSGAREPPDPELHLAHGGAHLQDRGCRPALVPVRRGRPGAPSVHARPRSCRRAREGRPQDQSRFGARLEPLSHAELVLHEGRGELQTVTGVELIRSHHAAREHQYRLGIGMVGAEAMLRLFPSRSGTSARSAH